MRRPLHNAPQPEHPEHPVVTALGSPEGCVSGILEWLGQLGIDVSPFEADHICFRCATTSEYRSVCALLDKHGLLLIESMIGGRPISTYLLKQALTCNGLTIRCVEVPCPKPGRPYSSGWEHIEFVIGSEAHSVHDRSMLCKHACARAASHPREIDVHAGIR